MTGISWVSSMRTPGTRSTGSLEFTITRAETLFHASSVKRRRVAPRITSSAPTSSAVLMIASAGSSPSTKRTSVSMPTAARAARYLEERGRLLLGRGLVVDVVVEEGAADRVVEGLEERPRHLHDGHHGDLGVLADEHAAELGDRGGREYAGGGDEDAHGYDIRVLRDSYEKAMRLPWTPS
jgi:hypothetical protein